MKILLLIFLLLACQSSYERPNGIPDSKLESRAVLYLSLMKRDKDGFILSEHCDSLLFTGLLAATAPELEIDLLKARDAQGNWHRRPNKDCGPEFGNSRTSISRDMILGVMWWAWRTKNLEVLEDLRDSLKFLVLPGTGDFVTRTLLPVYYKTLLQLIEKLGGKNAIHVPGGDVLSKQGGFVAHLNVLHILLRGEIHGSISKDHFDLLEYHAFREPKNPLYVGAYYLYAKRGDEIPNSLLNDQFGDRLPTTDDWCAPWVIQRDFGADWMPCAPFKTHTGADFVVMMGILNGRQNN